MATTKNTVTQVPGIATQPQARRSRQRPVTKGDIPPSMTPAGIEGFTVHAPLLHMSKAEIVALGSALFVPYADTWSCYKGGDAHCGVCGTCVERREAFQLAGVADPTRYMSE